MFKIAVFDIQKYEKTYFNNYQINERVEFTYFKKKLNVQTKELAKNFDAVCVFLNDNVDQETITYLKKHGIKLILTRTAGFNHIDVKYAKDVNIPVLRVPNYSPYSVAELALALLLSLTRKTPIFYERTRKLNFTVDHLIGSDIQNKIVGIYGIGRIGKIFSQIIVAMGAKVIAFDPKPDLKWAQKYQIQYLEQEAFFKQAEVISFHAPLLESTYHIVNKKTINQMKEGVILINAARGALFNTKDIIGGLKNGKIGGVGLDVYEHEGQSFYHDFSNSKLEDELLKELVSFDNVLITSHSAYFTKEALEQIYQTTKQNIIAFLDNQELVNQV